MQFILIGFSHDSGFRVFSFDGIGEDRTRTRFAVRTDLALIRNYGIQVQELPMLCRKLLERREETKRERVVTFTEEEMRVHAANCAAEREAAQRRRPPRRPGFGVSTPRPV
jgi:hypothetical protein